MGIFRRKNELRSMILKSYGGDWQYFVWNYANQIYDIPEVRTAIEKIADIFSCCEIWNERRARDGTVEYKDDAFRRVVAYKPNALQNKTQFYKNVVTQLLLESNAYIEPVYDGEGKLKALFPLQYRGGEIKLDAPDSGTITFQTSQGTKKYNLNDIIYLSRFCTLTGGKNCSLGLYQTVIKSLAEKIVNDSSPNRPKAILQGTLAGSGALKDKDKSGVMEDVKANFAKNVQGLAYLDKAWNITPINWNENGVNKDLMQFVVSVVYNYFSINENIVNNKASEIEMSMFVKNTIRPLANQFGEEFTNKLFTENEYYYGRRIEFDWSNLTVASVTAEAAAAQIYLRAGANNIDEIRERNGYPALPNGKGQIYRTSADLVNIDIVDDYELGKVGKSKEEIVDDGKAE